MFSDNLQLQTVTEKLKRKYLNSRKFVLENLFLKRRGGRGGGG